MLIVIPISHTDENIIEPFYKCLKHFGPYKKHDLLLVSRPSDSRFTEILNKELGCLFKNSNIYTFKEDGRIGWPSGPNFYFKQTIMHLKETDNKSPWLWMEADMTPMKKGWIDILERQYIDCNKPFMGWLENTTTFTRHHKLINLTKHLVGAAIYPPDITQYSTIWEHMDDVDIAFDVLLQFEIPQHSYHTDLFEHCFRTENYKEIIYNCYKGEDNTNHPAGLKFDKVVNPNVVLHHGCIDGSLANLLLKKEN